MLNETPNRKTKAISYALCTPVGVTALATAIMLGGIVFTYLNHHNPFF